MFHHMITTVRASLAALRPAVVRAHCDTADGPAATAGRRALATGNLNHALAWIPADGEAELRALFDRALGVRVLGPDAAELADRLFLETLVRLHRAGEGVGFTGIKAAGTPDPVVAAADAALASGSDAALLALTPEERRAALHERFLGALAVRDYDVDDVAAGRRFLAAYVGFVKHAEGEGHEHHAAVAHDGAPGHHHARVPMPAPAPAHAHAHAH